MQINKTSYNLNNVTGLQPKQQQVTFGVSAVKSKFFSPITTPLGKIQNNIETKIAHGLTRILGTNTAKKIIIKTKDNKKLIQHLTAFTGLILSGFYIQKTLENKKLDKDKRKTLAINQALVCAISTLGGYTIDHWLGASVERFSNKFMKINANEPAKDLLRYKNGIKNAASIMIFGTMYRFIGPVIVTPIANAIGNRVQEKKQATNK